MEGMKPFFPYKDHLIKPYGKQAQQKILPDPPSPKTVEQLFLAILGNVSSRKKRNNASCAREEEMFPAAPFPAAGNSTKGRVPCSAEHIRINGVNVKKVIPVARMPDLLELEEKNGNAFRQFDDSYGRAVSSPLPSGMALIRIGILFIRTAGSCKIKSDFSAFGRSSGALFFRSARRGTEME